MIHRKVKSIHNLVHLTILVTCVSTLILTHRYTSFPRRRIYPKRGLSLFSYPTGRKLTTLQLFSPEDLNLNLVGVSGSYFKDQATEVKDALKHLWQIKVESIETRRTFTCESMDCEDTFTHPHALTFGKE